MNSRNCPRCHFTTNVVKIGKTSSGRQRYKCKTCHKTWVKKPRPNTLAKHLWHDFIFHNQNITELSLKYRLSEKTIRNKLNNYEPPQIIPTPAEVIAMDVTYFGRTGGILTVINAIDGKVLYSESTGSYETVYDYEKAIRFLISHGVKPKAAVIDGKKGVAEMLEGYGIKVQMCQFHQIKIVTSCITRNPILEPNIELKNLVRNITRMKRETFEMATYAWKAAHISWLFQKTKLENGKWEYTHKLTRRAIQSLISHLPYLFTFQDEPNLKIPNTNNKIEGLHSELKRRLANHRGLKKSQKIKFARIFFSERTGV